MHPPGAEAGKYLHPEFKSSAHKLRYPLSIKENGVHARCIAFKIVHLASKSCTQGAGCTLNLQHCRVVYIQV